MTTDLVPCHWHPDRRAGVICQRCDLPICPSCMHQASVGFHCPNCTEKGKQKVMTGRAAFSAAFQPLLTYVLMGINIAIFFIGAAMGTNEAGRTDRILFDYGLFGGTNEYYRLLSAGFLHSGLIHVAVNMWALFSLGPMVERALGRVRFGLVYASALFAGSAGAVFMKPDRITVGASGALYGLFGALVVLYRYQGIDVMRSGLGLTIMLNVLITFTIPNISVGGHLGGFVGGVVATSLALYGPRALPSKQVAFAALAALVPAFFVLGMLGMQAA